MDDPGAKTAQLALQPKLGGLSINVDHSPILSAVSAALQDCVDAQDLSDAIAQCQGHSDRDRENSVAKILSWLGEGQPDPAKMVKKVSNLIFDQLFDLEVWYPPLHARGLTMDAELIQLDDSAIVALSAASKILTATCWRVLRGELAAPPDHGSWLRSDAVWEELSEMERICLEELVKRLDDAACSREFFVKLSTRSPKDSLVLRHRAEAHRQRAPKPSPPSPPLAAAAATQPRAIPARLRGKVSAAFLASTTSATDIALQGEAQGHDEHDEGARLALVNRSGWDALDLLCSSERVLQDFEKVRWREHQLHPALSSGRPLSVVVRPWAEVPRGSELRAFIVNRRLTALSQYFTSAHFPELYRHRSEMAQAAQRFVAQELGPVMPVPHAVADLAWSHDVEHRFVVIELNPFSRASGSANFDWQDDEDILMGRVPFECRVNDERCLSRWEMRQHE